MVKLDDLIGVPFSNNGRNIKTGVDCYGLCMEVYKRYGHKLPEYYAEYNDMKRINEIVKENQLRSDLWQEVSKDNLPVPCLVAIRFGSPQGVVNHTGTYIGDGKFIHIRENIGVCIDSIDSPAWKRVIAGFYQYVGDKR